MHRLIRLMCVVALTAAFFVAAERPSDAGYPVYVAPAPVVAPAVVGYTARRGGLFGQRTVMRPVVAPLAAPVAVAPIAVAPARTTALKPAPVVVAPTVRAYYAPPVQYVAPAVTVYHLPVVAYPF